MYVTCEAAEYFDALRQILLYGARGFDPQLCVCVCVCVCVCLWQGDPQLRQYLCFCTSSCASICTFVLAKLKKSAIGADDTHVVV